MVKIVGVEEQHDAGPDDDCCEISLEEFAKKVSLKEDDDVILIASKGKIVKVEADQSEDSPKAYDGYDTDTEGESSCNLGSGGRGQQAAAGDCVDNPCKIEEDETRLLKVKVEDMFVIGKPSGGCDKNERSCNAANVIPGVLVPAVKCEPVGGNGVEAAEEDSYDHCLEVAHEKRIFDEDDDEDVVVV